MVTSHDVGTQRGSPFDLDRAGLAGHRTLKWQRWPADVLPMWVAEMDVGTCPPVREELTRALERGETGYGYGDDYVEALAAFLADRFGWSFDPAIARVVPDVMQGCRHVLDLVTGPGDAVVVTPPVYGPFFAFTLAAGREVVEAPLGPDLRLDAAAMEAAFARATVDGRRAALLLCSPHNPTGVVHTSDELTVVAALARAHGVRVVVDEIHAPLVHPGVTFTSWLQVPGGEDGIVVTSASKGFNLAGMKGGVAIPGAAAVADLARLPEVVEHGASLFGRRAHATALAHGGDWQWRLVEAIADNHRLLADLVADHLPGVEVHPAEATFLAWLDCTALGWGDDPAAVFLERGRIGLNDGLFFGSGGAGHVRINVGTHPDVVREGVARMATAIAGGA